MNLLAMPNKFTTVSRQLDFPRCTPVHLWHFYCAQQGGDKSEIINRGTDMIWSNGPMSILTNFIFESTWKTDRGLRPV